jgi:hypothetical protein
MRKLVYLALFATLGCSRENSSNNFVQSDIAQEINSNKGSSALLGTWRRFEELRDPGNGSGQWTALPPAEQSMVTFAPNGEFQARAHSILSRFNHYEVVPPRELRLYGAGGDSATAYYSVEGKMLQLNYLVREAMQDRFVRE